MNTAIRLAWRKAGTLLFLIFIIISSCQKEESVNGLNPVGIRQGSLLGESKTYFQREVLAQAPMSNDGNLRHQVSKTPLWDLAEQVQLSIGPALKVPLSYEPVISIQVGPDKQAVPLSQLSYLLIYKDSQQVQHAEVVTKIPDLLNQASFSGIILVEDWWGRTIKTYQEQGNKYTKLTKVQANNKGSDGENMHAAVQICVDHTWEITVCGGGAPGCETHYETNTVCYMVDNDNGGGGVGAGGGGGQSPGPGDYDGEPRRPHGGGGGNHYPPHRNNEDGEAPASIEMAAIDTVNLQNYPRFKSIIKDIPAFLAKYPNIKKALAYYTGFSQAKIVQLMQPGKGPKVKIVPNLIDNHGQPAIGQYDKLTKTLQIKESWVRGLDIAQSEITIQTTGLLLLITTFHEFVHYGRNQNHLTSIIYDSSNGEYYEAGLTFEANIIPIGQVIDKNNAIQWLNFYPFHLQVD